ncbi:MAG: adenosylmethionine--8-amino-7-oxononanoate transaminase [endosymbiont of Galathealinum brachiosum]|uniref:Adenosylmethionine-8-amino-7-oxononanoate aminotransferase n=1 Tax=endosymbiont of Galathealinum brachiosum TaxID=2200906 RepID=A0A370DJ92_9GAMM|nr:MAG: adenosylmethionine--8-amino-7-oxononanoate transaminase [endosymbiont of Galathealinum brachiosum]
MDLYSQLIQQDRQTIWHPYSALGSDLPVFPVVSATGVRLKLADGKELIDGMSSWWSAIHGYNHPELNQAVEKQLKNMSHVMFGGLTHPPAVELANTLIDITPDSLSSVFFSDSGSVSVEVAMKMAIQYWHDKHMPDKHKFLTIRGGYHGDTFGAMSVCDPVTGMHSLFNQSLMKQIFIDSPSSPFGEECNDTDIEVLRTALEKNHSQLAAFIVEPVVQGAGGMRFYSSDYLNKARALCDEFNILLIFDEIATGFGRTGKLFACEFSQIQPDIMCIGKALTGGYMTLAATLTSTQVAQTISNGEPGVFMHGPTFMANPLACSVANASIKLLQQTDWQNKINQIESWLSASLEKCISLDKVKEVRVLGAIAVVECNQPVDMKTIQTAFVNKGVWIRPFGKLVYLMPPFIIEKRDIEKLCNTIFEVLK